MSEENLSPATVIDRSDHPISRRRIPENVLKVLYRLHRSGYRAYLCGGSVRDLLRKMLDAPDPTAGTAASGEDGTEEGTRA